MPALVCQLVALLAVAGGPLGPGDHNLSLKMGDVTRSYLVHIPPEHDPTKPTPVVLVLHGAGTNGAIMVPFCGLNEKADKSGFVAVYPNGTGLATLMLTWNSGGFRGEMGEGKVDDVAFLEKVARRPGNGGQRGQEEGLCHGHVQWRNDVLPAGCRAFGSHRRNCARRRNHGD
jgi:poly(3-hydroxybutyrate) depolymerase